MKEKQDAHDVGVIVGRFQVPSLHAGHLDLIRTVTEKHNKVLIFLGLSATLGTRENPLDFEARKQMLLESFPDVNVLYIKDGRSDEQWSGKLDSMIADVTTPAQSVCLYGARDSFVDRYHGKHPVLVLEAESYFSGSEVRAEVSRRSVRRTADFRAGVVWGAFNRYPTVYTTVDVAVWKDDYSKLLLGRKPDQDKFRLIGGFTDPTDPSFEAAARREVQEEAGIAITDPQYVLSRRVDDWRYAAESDGITTILFAATLLSGSPKPADDIVEVRWFEADTLNIKRDIVPEHQELVYHACANRLPKGVLA